MECAPNLVTCAGGGYHEDDATSDEMDWAGKSRRTRERLGASSFTAPRALRRVACRGPRRAPVMASCAACSGRGGRRRKLVLGPTWPIVGPWRPARGQPQEPGVPEATSSAWLLLLVWLSRTASVGWPPAGVVAAVSLRRLFIL